MPGGLFFISIRPPFRLDRYDFLCGYRACGGGASGFLGRVVCDVPSEEFKRIPAVRTRRPPFDAPSYQQMDITDAAQVDEVIGAVCPGWVINTAAETSVDGCEMAPEHARRVHVDGTRNLVRACERTGSGLITISTNYVFDGTEGFYGEEDTPRPLNVYGQTKLESEDRVLQAQCPGIVVRTAVLYGYRPGCRPNFVTWAAGALARGENIRVVTDEWTNPTYGDELAVFLLDLCRKDFRGLVHFGGADYLTRYEMVEQICACFDLDFQRVAPVVSEELGQKARRPLRAGLKVDRAREIFDGRVAPFGENLRRLANEVGGPAASGFQAL